MIRKLVPVLASAILILIAAFPWSPAPATASAQQTAGLKLTKLALPGATTNQQQRPVAPALTRIRRWISAVGASVAVTDLRGLGRDADGCLTDPRDDKVRVFPVPGGGGPQYPTFELKPTGLRYDATMAPIGCVSSDINQDGRSDFIVYYWGRSPVIFLNTAPRGATPSASTFRAEELVDPMQVWNTTALNVLDVDGDGRLDIMVGNYFPDGAKVLDPKATNDDYMAMQRSMGAAHNGGVNRLYLGQGARADGTPVFKDVSNALPSESARSWTLAFGAQDLTGDDRPEIYVANDFGPDQLLVNHSTPGNVSLTPVTGDKDLTTPKSKVLGNDSFKGMGVVFTYRNGQPLPNIAVSAITTPWALEESNLYFQPTGSGTQLLAGKVPYRDQSTTVGIAHSGWSWDLKAVDLTNSGQDSLIQANGFIKGTKNFWPRLQELAMGNDQILSDPFFWPTIGPDDDLSGHEAVRVWLPAGNRYVEAGAALGFTGDYPTRGIAVSDVNGDGKLDFLIATQWGPSYAYINNSKAGPGLDVRVVKKTPTGATTPLIGATATLTCSNGVSHVAQLYPANGHSGVSGTSLHFALPTGSATNCRVKTSWTDASGRHTTTTAVTSGTEQIVVNS